MGIPGFNSWFKSNHASAFVPLPSTVLDHVYIDMNSVLHLVLRKAQSMDHFHSLMFKKIDDILSATCPRKSVQFALDGPAPLAKLLTQRARRKKVNLTPAQEKGKVVPPLAITPGTYFMQDVQESLQYYICQRLIGSKFSHLQFELSGSTVKGEGEVKILSRLKHPVGNVQNEDTHVMIGNDSDLLIMALLSEAKHVHVLGQILDNYIAPRSMKVFSVDRLHKLWMTSGPSRTSGPVKDKKMLQALKEDFALTCIIGKGNDYLPAVQGASILNPTPGHNSLWEFYLSFRSGNPRFKNRNLTNRTLEGTTVLDREFLASLIAEVSKERQFPPESVRANLKAAEPDHYLNGLCWVMDMYHGGACPNYRFLYDGLGPSAKDIVAELHKTPPPSDTPRPLASSTGAAQILPKPRRLGPIVHDSSRTGKTVQGDVKLSKNSQESRGTEKSKGSKEDSINKPQEMQHGKQNMQPLSPVACALALLPRQGQLVIPKPLQHLMDVGSPIEDMFDECERCEALSSRASEIAVKITGFAKKKAELTERISILENGNSRQAEVLQEQLSRVVEQMDDLKVHARNNDQERSAHLEEVHPYQPFPVDRIEKAVNSVPITRFSEKELELTKFGTNFIYRRLDHQLHSKKMKFPQGKSKSNSQPNRAQGIRAPEPPSSRFKALRGPLPIQRSLMAGDEPGRIVGKLTRSILTVARRI